MNSKLKFYLGVRFDKRKNKKAIGKAVNDWEQYISTIFLSNY